MAAAPGQDQKYWFLSTEEVTALESACVAEGAQAKIEVDRHLSEVLELDTDTARVVMGAYARLIEGLDYEERRRLGGLFRDLGGLCMKGKGGEVRVVTARSEADERIGATVPVSTEVAEHAATHPVSHNGHGDGNGHHGGIGSADGNGRHVELAATVVTTEELPAFAASSAVLTDASSVRESRPHFREIQKRLLKLLFGADKAEDIGGLTVSESETLAELIGVKYVNLKIPRLGEAKKRERAAQMTLLLGGQTYQQIGEAYGVSSASIWQGLNKFVESIVKRTTKAERDDMLASVRVRAAGTEVAETEAVPVVREDTQVTPTVRPPERRDMGKTTIQARPVAPETVVRSSVTPERNPNAPEVLTQAVNMLSNTLGLGKVENTALRAIFDTQFYNVVYKEGIEDFYDILINQVRIVTEDQEFLPASMKWSDLERKAIRMLVGLAKREGEDIVDVESPVDRISVTAVNNRMATPLKKAQLNVEDVLRDAVYKMVLARAHRISPGRGITR